MSDNATALIVLCSVLVIAAALIIGFLLLIKRAEAVDKEIQKMIRGAFDEGYNRGYRAGSELFTILTAHKTINQVREFVGLEPIKDKDFSKEFKPKERKLNEEKN